MEKIEVYSEKLDSVVVISDSDESVMLNQVEEENVSLVGWSHSGWNNENGGAGW